MSWKDYNMGVGEMLNAEQFAYNPKKKVYTKKIGEKTAIVDITKEDVYFFGGDEGNNYDDSDGFLDGIRDKILGIVGQAADEPVPTVEHIDTAKTDATVVAPPEEPVFQEPDTKKDILPPPVTTIQSPPPELELTIEIVKKYINDKVTDEEAYSFIQLCRARHLNPFLKQVHLIKKEFTGSAKTVVGKDVFMERAERHPQYDGFEAGIIVKIKGKSGTEDHPGAFLDDGEILVGGWAKVYRKDQTHCTEARVSMTEYNTGMSSWKKIPATMIRKVGLSQAQREAFAAELSGMYDSSEMGVET